VTEFKLDEDAFNAIMEGKQLPDRPPVIEPSMPDEKTPDGRYEIGTDLAFFIWRQLTRPEVLSPQEIRDYLQAMICISNLMQPRFFVTPEIPEPTHEAPMSKQ
jgi:hypothetical protein